jgi:hypothetical protein
VSGAEPAAFETISRTGLVGNGPCAALAECAMAKRPAAISAPTHDRVEIMVSSPRRVWLSTVCVRV